MGMITMGTKATRTVGTNMAIIVGTIMAPTLTAGTITAIMATVSSGRT